MGLLSAEIDTKAMVPVCRQLATTYEAGIPILRAFEHVGRESRNPKVKRVCADIVHDIRSGGTLADAVKRQAKWLSPFFVQLLVSGEMGGRLDVMLRDLADYFEDRLAIQRGVRAAMAYPLFLLTVAWFLGSFALGMGNRAVAAFSDSSKGGIGGVEEFFGEWLRFQAVAMVMFAVLAVGFIALARAGTLGWVTGAVTTHVWPLSKVTRYFAMARFFRSFALLLESGVSVMQSIRGAAAVTANPYIERDLLNAIPVVKQGGTLVEAFSRSRYVTPMAREMLAIAETSGQMDLHLKKCADYHLKEANQAVRIATTVFTTIVMMGIFAAVGAVIITFYVRLYGGIFDALGV